MKAIVLLCMIAIAVSLFGCNQKQASSPVSPDDPLPVSANQVSSEPWQNNRYLWGTFSFSYDSDTNTCEVIPTRSTADHWNALRWLENGPCTNCVKVLNVTSLPSGNKGFAVQIKHPFSNPNFTGFDVRGIAMFQGGKIFEDSVAVIPDASTGTGELMNPDGWTAHMTPWTSIGGAPELQGYIQGRFASELGLLGIASVNGFKRYANSGDNPRNAFFAGTSITRSYEIDMPDADFVFAYAVDGCWAPPTNKPVDDVEEDFPGDANCAEAWRVDVSQTPIGQGLHESGGAVFVDMDIYDYTPGSVLHVYLECPELFDGLIEAAWMGFDPGWIGQAQALVVNENKPPVGEYECLISVVDELDGSSPLWMDLTFYQVITLRVEEDDLYGFARTWGGSGHDGANDVAADELGNIYVAGVFRSTVDFDPGDDYELISSAGDMDCFLSKYDTLGQYQWTRTWGGPGEDSTGGISIDEVTGLLYLCGHFSDEVDFNPDSDSENIRTSEGGTDGFITRFSPDGEYAGTMWIQGPGEEEVYGVDVDSSGYPVACGYAEAGVTFHPSDDPHTMHGGHDVFVVRYWPDFLLDWFIYIGGDQDDEACDVVCDDLDNIIYCGRFRNNTDSSGVDFRHTPGADIHTSSGLTDAFLIKVTSAAAYEWGRSWGGTQDDAANGVGVTNTEVVLVCGGFKNMVDFDPGTGDVPVESSGNYDAFLSRFSPDGEFDWVKTWGGYGDDRALTLAVNSYNNPIVGGFFSGTVDFNPTSGTDEWASNGSVDVFITKYQITGAYLWTRAFGSGATDTCQGIAVGESTNIYGAGIIMGGVDFAPPSSPPDFHTGSGMGDCFLVKYLTNGNW